MRIAVAAIFVLFAAVTLPSVAEAQAGLGRQKPPQQQDNKKQEEPQPPQNKQQGGGKKDKEDKQK